MSEWKIICRVDDIPVLGSRRVSRPVGVAVAVFRNSRDEVFALLDRCPHKGGPLSQGIVFGTSVSVAQLDDWPGRRLRASTGRRLRAEVRLQSRGWAGDAGRPGAGDARVGFGGAACGTGGCDRWRYRVMLLRYAKRR